MLSAAPFLVSACSSSADCDKEGEAHCEGSVIRVCERQRNKLEEYLAWSSKEFCGSPSLCVAPEGDPFCVLSSTPAESCKDHEQACDGDAILACRAGFVVSRRDCTPAETCVQMQTLASCQPKPDPACKSREIDPCMGDEAVYCNGGLLIKRMACPACRLVRSAVSDASTETTLACGQAMNEACNSDGDCTMGLSCIAQTCTLACTVQPGVSDFCQAVLGDPYHQTWFAKNGAGLSIQTGSCQEGVCVWQN
jgi:hypothetical protein